MKQLSLFLILLSLYSCTKKTEVFWPETKSPHTVYSSVTKDLLSREEFMMYTVGDVSAVHYAEVCAAFGAARLAGSFKDTTTTDALAARYLKVLTDSIENTANHVDANVYGILPLELFKQGQDSIFFKQGIVLADQQWEEPLPNGLTNQTRFWIDDVWMVGSLQVQAYRLTGNAMYLDRAAVETAAYLEKLQQPNGLFFHGEQAPFFWGRGNGWMAAGLAEVLWELPKNHKHYETIVAGYKKMMASLLEYQTEDGMWRQLVDHDIAWKEASCTGMFGYAMAVGVKKGILPKAGYQEAYEKAWLALTDYITPEGKVTDVCVGTGQSMDVNYYLERPTVTGDFHGQAPVLWFAYALQVDSVAF